MSVSASLQKLLIDTLKADAGVIALVGADVFDSIPTRRPAKFLRIGPSDMVLMDMTCLRATEMTFQIDGYSAGRGELVEARRMVDAVIAALDDMPLALPDPYALTRINVELARVFLDADETTGRAVVQVTCETEKVTS